MQVAERPRLKSRDQEALTADRLRELVAYDEQTGTFVRKDGRATGLGTTKAGYLRMRIDGVLHYQHRLAWLYVTGGWPNGVIDHIDGDKTNNRIANLRDTDKASNALNSTGTKAVSGFRGVYWHEETRKWQAKIQIGAVSKSLGYYSDPRVAASVYDAKRKELAGLA